jgi:N12 class adenine-specific DNA methylase
MSPEIKLDAHQRNGAARIIYVGNSLLGHVVARGKRIRWLRPRWN